MNRLRLALLVPLVFAAACGGGGDGTVTPPPPDEQEVPEIVSGTFVVTSALISNGCDQSSTWGGQYEIEIDSTSFAMGPWTGTWNARTGTAVAESVHDITETRNCRVSRYTTVYVTFKDADTFKATLLYQVRLGGDCGDRASCTTSWWRSGASRCASLPGTASG